MKKLIRKSIKLYQQYLSPLFPGRQCRYIPTCSQYAYDSVEEYGAIKGTYMGIKRILRCHPWATHDMHDPVLKTEQ